MEYSGERINHQAHVINKDNLLWNTLVYFAIMQIESARVT